MKRLKTFGFIEMASLTCSEKYWNSTTLCLWRQLPIRSLLSPELKSSECKALFRVLKSTSGNLPIMTKIETLCLSCMTDKGGSSSCPHCGNDEQKQRNAIALPMKTVLNKRFLVGRVLGRPGGFGITYLVWDMLLETTAAIKEFLPLSSVSRQPGTISVRANSKQDQDFFNQGLRIFLKEARTLAQFSHPNIVRIRDCFTANNTAYLVMEYHQGRPLDEAIKDEGGRMSEDRALEIMLPILDGLDAVHKKGFLHRDVKPQNIYLTEKGTPVLLDFGASRFALADTTKTLTVMLSAGYAPFEQYHQKGKQGPWSDIYSCGATLYSMVTGRMPDDAIERQHDDKLLPPIKLNPGLSEGFSAAIMKALETDPRSRPHNITALKQILIGTSFRPSVAQSTGQFTPAIHARSSRLEHKAERRPVVIQYDSRKDGSRLGRWLLYVGLAAVLWFSWSTRQLLESNSGFNSPQERVRWLDNANVMVEDDGSVVDYVEIIEPPPPMNTAEIRPVYPQPETPVNPTPSEARDIKPIATNPGTRDPAMAACQDKRPHLPCFFDSPEGRLRGLCLPVESGRLACSNEPPPFYPPPRPHPPVPHFRR